MPEFLGEIKLEVMSNPIAQKMGYEMRLEKKTEMLLRCLPSPDEKLRHFFEEVLFNVSIRDTDLINVLKFLDKLEGEELSSATNLFAIVWPEENPAVREKGLSEDKQARDKLKRELFDKIDVIRRYAKAGPLSAKQIKKVIRMKKVLDLGIIDVLRIVTISPYILHGLRKTPRPIYSWIIPALIAASISYALVCFISTVRASILYLSAMAIVVLGTYWVSMYLKIAPGILYYEKTQRYLSRVIKGICRKTRIEERMEKLGINISELEKEMVYEDKGKGIRIVIRNKKTLEGAIKFLTSSDEIGSCAALENFVSWTLPSLLDDDGILLADVYYKGTESHTYSQRAQIWMVAAEEEAKPPCAETSEVRPVLVVNSFEFNNEGAKYIDELMPEIIKVLQDVAGRAGFRKIYVGISTFGRSYLDRHFPQGQTRNVPKKIHDPEAGYQYYFDVFSLGRSFANWRIKRDYIYDKKRGLIKRAYAPIFGVIEFLKGNRAKARAFFDTLLSPNNFWEIPLLTNDPLSPEG